MKLTKLGLGNNEHLLNLGLLLLLLLSVLGGSANGLRQELGQRIGQSAVLDSREVLDGRSGRRESLDSLDLEAEG